MVGSFPEACLEWGAASAGQTNSPSYPLLSLLSRILTFERREEATQSRGN